MLDSEVDASLRGLCVVDDKTVWASGTTNTVIRTTDGGSTWQNVSPELPIELDFRDVHGFDAENAILLSAGQPARVYITSDGGKHWKLAFQHPNDASFFDALSFWDRKRGIAMSDPIDGRVLLIETNDGGMTWNELANRPNALPGEAGFAASGTNLSVLGDRTIHVALGGAPDDQRIATSRIVSSADAGQTWTSASVPMPRTASAGIFSIAFDASGRGIAVGGDYKRPDQIGGNVATTNDGGATWSVPTGAPPQGFRSGVAMRRADAMRLWVAVGTNGTDISIDDGQSWRRVSSTGFHAVQFAGAIGFACGADGRIAKWIGE